MKEFPLAPQWDKKECNISDKTKSTLKELYLEASFSSTSKEIIQKADELGLNHIGTGTGRIVFAGSALPERTVVKIAKNQRGYQDNLEEAHLYGNVRDELKQYLAPVLQDSDDSGNWILMPKCRDASHETADQFRDYFEKKGLNYRSTEVAAPNFGRYLGSPCIMDYASMFTI